MAVATRGLKDDMARWEINRQNTIWRNKGRQGHAPTCNIKKMRDLEVTREVAVAWSVRTTLQCRGCGGVFIEWD